MILMELDRLGEAQAYIVEKKDLKLIKSAVLETQLSTKGVRLELESI